jgi:hypothetical protein
MHLSIDFVLDEMIISYMDNSMDYKETIKITRKEFIDWLFKENVTFIVDSTPKS